MVPTFDWWDLRPPISNCTFEGLIFSLEPLGRAARGLPLISKEPGH
jgi:hypothetical protein